MESIPKDTPNQVVHHLRRLYRPIGFRSGLKFALWFVLGGALVGFCAARLRYLDFRGVLCPSDPLERRGAAVPGECYHFEDLVGRAGIMMHLAAVLPASVMAVFQFVPAVRYRFLTYHRVAGYVVIMLSVVSMLGVVLIAKPTFGGSIAMQSATGTAVALFLACLGMGYYNIKKLRLHEHRAWMLRAWVSFIITMRIISISMALITSRRDPQYLVGSCKVIDYMYSHNATAVEALYPDCASFYSGAVPDQRVIIKGDIRSPRPEQKATGLNAAFGAGAWLALAIHCVAAEVYLRHTPGEAERLRRVSSRRQPGAGVKSPRNSGRMVQGPGETEPWAAEDAASTGKGDGKDSAR